MKVALYQMHIVWEDKEENYRNIEEKLNQICDRDIDLLLMPEMCCTGFSMNTSVTKENDGKTIKKMTILAKQYHIALGFGWVKDCGIKAENHYTVISYSGEILSDYVKIHPFSYCGENEKFQGGNNIEIFRLNDIIFSSFICYDLRFPEVFQIVSKVANVILLPANWPEERKEHWKYLLRARAIENQVYVLAVNCVGQINGLNYSGDSCVINPNGDVLIDLSGQEGILEYELRDDVQKIREEFPLKQDRRETLYSVLGNELKNKRICDGKSVNHSGAYWFKQTTQ